MTVSKDADTALHSAGSDIRDASGGDFSDVGKRRGSYNASRSLFEAISGAAGCGWRQERVCVELNPAASLGGRCRVCAAHRVRSAWPTQLGTIPFKVVDRRLANKTEHRKCYTFVANSLHK